MSSSVRDRGRRAVLLDPSESLQSEAEAWWDAAYYDGGTSLYDRRNGHNAQLGSTAGADSNDPLFLRYAGTPYLYLPGASGNYASVPDAPAVSVTGDLECIVGAQWAWTTGAVERFVGKRTTANGTAYDIYMSTGQIPSVFDGTTVLTAGAKAPLADNVMAYIRYRVDVDNGGGGKTLTVHYSTDYDPDTEVGTWTLVGTGSGGTAGALNDTVDPVEIGSYNAGTNNQLTGRVYRVQLYNGIAGTKVLDIDFTDLSAYNAARTSLTAVTGQTVTINRATSGRKSAVVERNVFLFGTDDYMEVADAAGLNFGAGDSFTVVWVGRAYDNTGGNFSTYISKINSGSASSNPGYHISSGNAGASSLQFSGWLNDGVDSTQVVTAQINYSAGVPHLLAMRVVRNETIKTFLDGVEVASVSNVTEAGTLSNALVLRIGSKSNSAEYGHFEFFGAAIFRRALTTAEIQRLMQEFNV